MFKLLPSKAKLISPTHPTLNLSHPTPDLFTWNTLLSSSSSSHHPLSLFRRMLRHGLRPDLYTFPLLLRSVPPSPPLLSQILLSGLLLHPLVLSSLFSSHSLPSSLALHLFQLVHLPDLPLYNSLLSSLLSSGLLAPARTLFLSIPHPNTISWTTLIAGHVQSSDHPTALSLFRSMLSSSVPPNHYTLSAVATACAHSAALDLGMWAHAYVARRCIPVNDVLGTAFIDMYSKCGRIDMAHQVFDALPGQHKDVKAWTAMLTGLAMHGRAEECLLLFEQMLVSGVIPNDVAFLGVLCACDHSGRAGEAACYFDRMVNEFQIVPTIRHYGCIVDLYARVGLLREAWDVVNSMPMEPDELIWGALLSGSRTNGDIAMCEASGKKLIELQPKNSAGYVLLSNLYAKMRRWGDVKRLRDLMEMRGVKKTPGSSVVEVNGCLHEFFAGDMSHSETRAIYAMLDEIVERLRLEGYVMRSEEVLLDLDEEGKELALAVHSEKLAIAFSLLATTPGTAVRVVKNLRVCVDCHEAIKLVSKIYGREIVVRDCSRFHHFCDGGCSCKDYW